MAGPTPVLGCDAAASAPALQAVGAWAEPERVWVAGGSVGRRRARGEVLEGPRGR
jgi:hypothetical protein